MKISCHGHVFRITGSCCGNRRLKQCSSNHNKIMNISPSYKHIFITHIYSEIINFECDINFLGSSYFLTAVIGKTEYQCERGNKGNVSLRACSWVWYNIHSALVNRNISIVLTKKHLKMYFVPLQWFDARVMESQITDNLTYVQNVVLVNTKGPHISFGESTDDSGFSSQRSSNTESGLMLWRHMLPMVGTITTTLPGKVAL